MTLDKWPWVFFRFLEDALQMSKPQGIIIHLSLTPLNVAFDVSKYSITTCHTTAWQAIPSQINRQEMEAHRMTKWLFQHHDTSPESQELNLYFLHLDLTLSFCCVLQPYSFLERKTRILRVCHATLVDRWCRQWDKIVALPTSKGGICCTTSACWKKH